MGTGGNGRARAWPRRVRRAQLAAALVATGLVVALAQQPVRGGFAGATGSAGNQIGTAADFCTSPGSTTVTADADSFVDQSSPTSTAGGGDYYLIVDPRATAARRAFVRFAMPTVPAGCTVTAATLRIFSESQASGRTLGAYRADPTAPAWTEAGLSWNNQPAALGTAPTVVVPTSDQYLQWAVASLVRDIYSAGNNGFVIRDQDETGGSAAQQLGSRSATDKPQLYVAWS